MISQCVSLEPTSAKYVVEKAEMLCELGRYKDAIEFLSQAKCDDMKDVLQEIKNIQAEIDSDSILPKGSKTRDTLEKLLKWGADNGADLSKVKLVYYTKDFRGIHAAKRIKAGDRIITIPEKLVVTFPKILSECKLAKQVVDTGIALEYPFATALACLVYESRGNDKSFYKLYAESFPDDVSTYPYWFKEDELVYLRGTCRFASVLGDKEQSITEYKKIIEKFPEFSKISADEYLKLTTLASSRYFCVADVPEKLLSTPIIDMFNYYTDKVGQTKWKYIPEEKAFTVMALKDIKRNEIVGLDYGEKASTTYLVYYGFIPENNILENVLIRSYLNKGDPMLKEKQKILCFSNQELALALRSCYMDWTNKPISNDKMMANLRFIVYKGDVKTLAGYVRNESSESNRHRKVRVPSFSKENEIDALALLKEIAEGNLKQFLGTLKDDEEKFKNDKKLTFNGKNALTIKITERREFNKIVEFADKMVELLKKQYDVVKKEVESMPESLWYREYAVSHVLPLLNK